MSSHFDGPSSGQSSGVVDRILTISGISTKKALVRTKDPKVLDTAIEALRQGLEDGSIPETEREHGFMCLMLLVACKAEKAKTNPGPEWKPPPNIAEFIASYSLSPTGTKSPG